MSKRQKFVLTTVFLCAVFLFSASFENINRLLTIAGLSVLSILLFYWSLSENLQRNATLLVLLTPGLFTFGVGSFWFLVPSNPLAKVPIILLYGIGLYALSLTANIYSVSAVRTIALLRAAKSVGFVITLFTSFLLYDAVLSAKLNVPISLFLVFIVTSLLVLPNLWAIELHTKISKKVLSHTLSYSYVVSLFYFTLYFWPISVVEYTIFLTVILYILMGMGEAAIEGRLFRNTVRDYLLVGGLVFLSMILFTSWRG